MLWRIDLVDAACDGGDSAGVHRSRMRLAIDPARHARNNDIARLTQIPRQIPRHPSSGSRRIPRADHRDGRAVQQVAIAPHCDNGRRRIDCRKAR